MGVFAGHMFAASLDISARTRSATSAAPSGATDTPGEVYTPAPARGPSWDRNPSSRALRADLEAMRLISRVK